MAAKPKFPRRHNYWDALGTPAYVSECRKYRILHVRIGYLNKEGKPFFERFYCHFKKGRSIHFQGFVGIGTAKTRIRAVRICINHWKGNKRKNRRSK